MNDPRLQEGEGSQQMIIHASLEHSALFLRDDIQIVLTLLGEFYPISLDDLERFRQGGLVTIEDIVRGKWDLIEGTFDDIIQPEVALIVHLFVVWFEVWLNLRGDGNVRWRSCLMQFTGLQMRITYWNYVASNYCSRRVPSTGQLEQMYGSRFRLLMIPREELIENNLLNEVST
jgi:hypothetical protein